VISTDKQGRILLFNKGAEELFGYAAAEVLGKPVEMLLPPRLRVPHGEALAALARASPASIRILGHRREVVGRRKQGDEFPAEATLSSREINGRTIMTVVVRDMTVRRRAEEQRLLYCRELGHRFKNLMAVVNAVVSLTARSAPTKRALVTSLEGRLESLTRSQDMLLESDGKSADLRQLLQRELGPYRLRRTSNILLSGEDCALPARSALTLALAVHELATNAAKYGALSRDQGRIEIRWLVDADDVVLRWVESGGPPVAEPGHVGFGTELIQRLLGPGARIEYRPEGLQAEIRIMRRA
jgi:PAS domain S-box-containing protein